ncbi:hypothetical protein DPMN_113917 [Dreissena polymorpha]|uniref:Uncharacterized protein n=1 Tax=Dreissena polymorpha TaxID=45954 RepID=A0A9D4KJ29_DREPO|nr:hypothetical protein DPMN_113917 [Dreissena polymorpha]
MNNKQVNDSSYDATRISTIKLRIRYGLNGPLRIRGNCDGLVRTGRNELRLNIAPTASCIVIHKMPSSQKENMQAAATDNRNNGISRVKDRVYLLHPKPRAGRNQHNSKE